MTTSMKDVETAADDLGDSVSNAMASVSGKVDETVATFKHTATESFDRVESAIRRNPLAAASIAGGIGFFLAILARR